VINLSSPEVSYFVLFLRSLKANALFDSLIPFICVGVLAVIIVTLVTYPAEVFADQITASQVLLGDY
jgi:hypothetical protein